jgi:hypothetical protein
LENLERKNRGKKIYSVGKIDFDTLFVGKRGILIYFKVFTAYPSFYV